MEQNVESHHDESEPALPFCGKLEKDKELKYGRTKLEKTIFRIWKKTIKIKQRLENESANSKTNDSEKLNYGANHPTPYIFAKFAQKASEQIKKYEKDLPTGWKFLTTAANENNGYFGVAYWHLKSQQVVIAHRGTEISSINDIITDIIRTDLKGIVFNKYVKQMNSASTFTYRIINLLNKLDKEFRTNFQLFFTGHSLGGWLAQITTFTAKYLTIINDDNKNPLFGSFPQGQDGYHAHTVVFDSPGCKKCYMRCKVVLLYDILFIL